MLSPRWHLLPLSADTPEELSAATADLVAYLVENPQLPVAVVAQKLQSAPVHQTYRRIILCQSGADALHALKTEQPSQIITGVSRQPASKVTFLFPGLGDQYVNMAAQLYDCEPRFRAIIDTCSEQLIEFMDLDLRTVLYSNDESDTQAAEILPQGSPNGKFDLRQMVGRAPQKALGRLKETAIAQPALFVIEYALAELWRAWGVKPAAMAGYSLGEYVAATQAGVFSLAESLQVVAHRAKLIDQLPMGSMLAIGLPEERVSLYLNPSISLSAINGPMMCVVAGSAEAIASLEQQLAGERVACRQIQTTHAFHSYMMQPASQPLQQFVETLPRAFPQIPFVSNVTGKWITLQQATAATYWSEHMRQPVRFADAVQTIWARPNTILLEVGLGQTLGGLAMQHPVRRTVENPIIIPSLPSPHRAGTETFHMLSALGRMWVTGVAVDWQGVYGTHSNGPL